MMSITLPYRILSVDPATGKSGWSILDLIRLNPLQVRIIAHGQFDGEKLFRKQKEMAERFHKQFCTLAALGQEYEDLMRMYKPDIVVSESAFGYAHMNALISLTLAINELRRASRIVLDKDIVTVPPTITKKAFTGSGSADKDHMRLAYQTHIYLEGKVEDGNIISEHEIDAIGHGIGFIRRDIIGDIVQISAKDKKKKKK